jgi:hypothetical protein
MKRMMILFVIILVIPSLLRGQEVIAGFLPGFSALSVEKQKELERVVLYCDPAEKQLEVAGLADKLGWIGRPEEEWARLDSAVALRRANKAADFYRSLGWKEVKIIGVETRTDYRGVRVKVVDATAISATHAISATPAVPVLKVKPAPAPVPAPVPAPAPAVEKKETRFYAYVRSNYREYALTTTSPVFSLEGLALGYVERLSRWLTFRAEMSPLSINMQNSSATFSSLSQVMYFTGDTRIQLAARKKLKWFGIGARSGTHLAYNWQDGLRDRLNLTIGASISLGPLELSSNYQFEELQPNPNIRASQDTLQKANFVLSYRPFPSHDWRIFVSTEKIKFVGTEYVRFLDYNLGFGAEFRYKNWFLVFRGQKYNAKTQNRMTGEILDPPGWLFNIEGRWAVPLEF